VKTGVETASINTNPKRQRGTRKRFASLALRVGFVTFALALVFGRI